MPNPLEFPFDIRKNTTETREVIQTGYLAPAEQKILTSKTERALKRLENEITKINKNEKQKIRSEKNTYQVTTQAEKIPAPREIDLHHEAYPSHEGVHQRPEAYPIEADRDNEPYPSHEVYRQRTAISKETITKHEELKLLQAKAQELLNEYEKNQAPIIKGKPIGEYGLGEYKGITITPALLAHYCREPNNTNEHGGLVLAYHTKTKEGITQGRETPIPKGSALLKVLQIYLHHANHNIADGNKKHARKSIDGYFANDSLTALKAYQREQQQKDGWLVDVFAEFDRELLDNTKQLNHLRQERGKMYLTLEGDRQIIESYEQKTILNIKKGIIMINDTLQFPYKLTLDRNSKTNTFIDNPQNRERLKKIYGLANILNRAQYLSSKIHDKEADHYQPFHIDKGGMNIISPIIQVENGTDDLNLIKIKSLESYAKSFEVNLNTFTTSLITFLNKVHKSTYDAKPTSRARSGREGRTY